MSSGWAGLWTLGAEDVSVHQGKKLKNSAFRLTKLLRILHCHAAAVGEGVAGSIPGLGPFCVGFFHVVDGRMDPLLGDCSVLQTSALCVILRLTQFSSSRLTR